MTFGVFTRRKLLLCPVGEALAGYFFGADFCGENVFLGLGWR
jgi:hypothetical protein